MKYITKFLIFRRKKKVIKRALSQQNGSNTQTIFDIRAYNLLEMSSVHTLTKRRKPPNEQCSFIRMRKPFSHVPLNFNSKLNWICYVQIFFATLFFLVICSVWSGARSYTYKTLQTRLSCELENKTWFFSLLKSYYKVSFQLSTLLFLFFSKYQGVSLRFPLLISSLHLFLRFYDKSWFFRFGFLLP